MFRPDGTQVISVSLDGTVRAWRLFPDAQTLVDYAKDVVPRALTREQRESFFLDPEPPGWCVEKKKWPYSTVASSIEGAG